MVLPEPLVTVCEYNTPDEAQSDKQLLDEAGITNYLGGSHYRRTGLVELKVPESEAREAFRILEIEIEEAKSSANPTSFRCPKCMSGNLRHQPPFLVLTALALIPAIALLVYYGRALSAFFTVLAGIALLAFMDRYVPRWRCELCEYTAQNLDA